MTASATVRRSTSRKPSRSRTSRARKRRSRRRKALAFLASVLVLALIGGSLWGHVLLHGACHETSEGGRHL